MIEPDRKYQHISFTSITRGLNRQSFPMRLFEKAKRLGIWNPPEEDDFITFAMDQFSRRFERLENARNASLADVETLAIRVIDQEIEE